MDTHSPSTTRPLFRPFPFGKATLPNRVVMAPMTRSQSPGNIANAKVAEYYRRRVEGGVGLIITEGTFIGHPAANGYPAVPAIAGDAALAGWKAVVDAVHAAGGHIIPQIWHVGNARRPGIEPDPTVPGYGPLEVRDDKGTELVHAMSAQDIADTVAAYAQAAADAQKVGFDGVEIHGAHGYLIDNFLWEGSNTRTDAYGGSLEKRLRFALEVVAAVRAAVTPDFPIVFRFSQWKPTDYNARIAQTPDELARILLPLRDAGVDIFHPSTRRFWDAAFEGSDDTLAAWTRRLTGRPVIAVGSVGLDKAFSAGIFRGTEDPLSRPTDVTLVEEGLARGDFDLIAVGRALLSEPDWANKVRDGRVADIRAFDKDALMSLVV